MVADVRTRLKTSKNKAISNFPFTTKPQKKAVKFSDGGGLFLLIQPSGTKLWRLAYQFADKQKLLAFGVYPNVSLADARAQQG